MRRIYLYLPSHSVAELEYPSPSTAHIAPKPELLYNKTERPTYRVIIRLVDVRDWMPSEQ